MFRSICKLILLIFSCVKADGFCSHDAPRWLIPFKPDWKKAEDNKLGNVDLTEHTLANMAIDTKDPSASPSLSPDEATARLARDGPNQLMPPKKKSALQKYPDC